MIGGKQSKISILLELRGKGFDKELAKAQRNLSNFGKKMKGIGRSMSYSLTAPIALVGAATIKLAVDFEKAMAKVQAISGATEPQFERLAASARAFGAATAFTATEVAGLQLELAKLGFKPEQIENATQGILDLAFAFDNDLAETAATAAETLNQFALDASQTGEVADIMAAAFSNSALDLTTFGEAMSKAGPVARAAGLDVKETTAILGILANNGIKGADAGTKLKIALTEIRKAGLPVKETLQQIANGSFDFESGLALLGKRAEILNPILGSNKENLDKFTSALDNSQGALSGAVDIMEDTADGALKKMNSAIQGAAESVGVLFIPLIRSMADGIAEAANFFNSFGDTTKLLIASLLGLVALAGPVLFMLGGIASGAAVAYPAVISLGRAFDKLTVSLYAALGPFAPLIFVAVAAATAIGYVAASALEAERDLKKQAKAQREVETTAQKMVRVLGRDVDTESISDLTKAIQELEDKAKETKPAVDEFLSVDVQQMNDGTQATGALAAQVQFLDNQLGVVNDTMSTNTELLQDGLDYEEILITLKQKRAALERRMASDAAEDQAQANAAVEEAIKGYNELLAVQAGFARLGLNEGKASENLKGLESSLESIIEATIKAGGDASKWADQLKEVRDRMEDVQELEDFEELQTRGVGRSQVDEGSKTLKGSVDLTYLLSTAAQDAEQSYSALATSIRMVGDALLSNIDYAGIFSNAMGSAFQAMFQGSKSAGEAMRDMAANVLAAISAQVSAMMIQAAVQTALAGGPAAMILAPALIGVGLSMASAAFSSIPAFAEGGAVLGPTLALVGEKPGSRGEAIIPFEKIGQFVDQVSDGGSSNEVIVTGRISGSDIALSNRRGGVARSRRR